jgi:phage terminase large subunit-like protein
VFSADDQTGDGVIPSDAFIDELHRHKDLRLYRTWRGKLLKRGGQLATISTAGEPGAEFEMTRERIRQDTPVVLLAPGYTHCRSKAIAFHEYAVPEGGDVEDMPTVKLANPFSGITVQALADKWATPTMTLEHWRRFVCNLATRASNSAITEAEWYAAKVDDAIPEGKPIDLGMDVAWKWDTTALVPMWWKAPDYRLLGPATILTPPRDGSMLSSDDVERAIIDIHRRNPIATVVMDPSKAEQLAEWIEKEIGARVLERTQSNAQAVEDFERFMEALRNGWLKHTGDAGLTRHVLNAVAKTLPQGDVRFERPSSTRQGGDQEQRVIDALTAASIVHSLVAMNALQPAGMGVGYVAYEPD